MDQRGFRAIGKWRNHYGESFQNGYDYCHCYRHLRLHRYSLCDHQRPGRRRGCQCDGRQSDWNYANLVPFTVTITNLDNLDTLAFDWSSEPPGIFTANGNQATVILESGTATLTVIITNQFGCTDTLTFKFEVVPFEVSVQDTVVVCFGEPEGLNPEGNTNYTYQWSPADNLSNPNIANPIYTGNVDATYTVLINDPETGCEIILTVFVDVTDSIGLSVSPGDTTVCALDPLTLTASSTLNGVTFSWQRPLGSEIGTGGAIVVRHRKGTIGILYWLPILMVVWIRPG